MLKLASLLLLLAACAWAAPKVKVQDSHKIILPPAPVQKRTDKEEKHEVAPHPIIGSKLDTETWQAPTIYTTLKIGTTPVSFKLAIDLYYDNLLIIGPNCKSLSCRGLHNNRTVYDPSKSKTSKDAGDPFRDRYKINGGAPISGKYYTDNADVDGISDTGVAFAVLDVASKDFYNVEADGVFGLSFLGNPRGKKNFDSPVNSILKSADKKLVTLWFNKATENKDRYGSVTFGKLNSDKCSTSVQYMFVSDIDYSFTVEKIRFSNIVAHRELRAKIDPTSRYIGLPTTIYKAVLRTVSASSSSDNFLCSNVKDLTFDIKIGGNYYSLEFADYVYKSSSSSSYCNFLLQDIGDDFDTGYILGEPFFRRNCITYDTSNNQIGFSSAK